MGKNRPKGGLLGGFDQLRAPDAPTISGTAAVMHKLVLLLLIHQMWVVVL